MTPTHVVTQEPRLLPWCSCITDEREKAWGRHAVYSHASAIHHFRSYPIGHASDVANLTIQEAGKCRELVDIDKQSGHYHNYYLPHPTVEETVIQKNRDIAQDLAASGHGIQRQPGSVCRHRPYPSPLLAHICTSVCSKVKPPQKTEALGPWWVAGRTPPWDGAFPLQNPQWIIHRETTGSCHPFAYPCQCQFIHSRLNDDARQMLCAWLSPPDCCGRGNKIYFF